MDTDFLPTGGVADGLLKTMRPIMTMFVFLLVMLPLGVAASKQALNKLGG